MKSSYDMIRPMLNLKLTQFMSYIITPHERNTILASKTCTIFDIMDMA